jgi:hypothetical protein
MISERKNLLICLFCIINFLFVFNISLAHPGRTDSSGCHTCRTNCASWGLSNGEYHCHRAKTSAPQLVEPVRSHKGENGQSGFTTAAPDYKIPAVKDSTKEEGDKNNSIWYIGLIAMSGAGYWIYKSRKK